MKPGGHLFLTCAIGFLLTMTGCATNTSSSIPNAQAPLTEVPHLKVLLDCGGCQVRPNAGDLIVDGYTEAVARAGAKLSRDLEATVSIKEYTARDDTARMLVGVFAGKDEIKAVVTFKGKRFEVEDYYRNAWFGINSLSRKIGELVFEKMTQ